MNNTRFFVAMMVGAIAVAGANAQTYRWTWSPTTGPNNNIAYNPNGGAVRTIDSTFNASTNRFTYDVEFSNRDTNGYWLVVSPGANPKGHAGELAILFVDASTTTPTVLSYAYNGQNGHSSWFDGSPAAGTQAPDLIRSSLKNSSWVNNVSVHDSAAGRRISLDINATAIQNHTPRYPGPGGVTEWTGVGFKEKFGIWFHPVKGLQTEYNCHTGGLKKWNFQKEGWVDGSHLETVPEPMSMTALALGMAAMARKRKAKKSA